MQSTEMNSVDMESSSTKDALYHLVKSLDSKAESDAFPISDFQRCIEATSETDRFSAFKSQCDRGWTILHREADWGNVEVVKLVLGSVSPERGVELLNLKEDNGDTPLHNAAVSFNLESIEYIMKWLQSDIGSLIKLLNVRGLKGMTPLHRACWPFGSLDALKHIRNSIPPDCWIQLLKNVDDEQQTPLHLACNGSNMNTIKNLLGNLPAELQLELLSAENKQKFTPLHLACSLSLGSSTLVKYILDIVPPENHFQLLQRQNVRRETPLHVGCKKYNSGQLKHILKVLPSHHRVTLLGMKDEDGDTPLHIACRYPGYPDNAQQILDSLSPESQQNQLNSVNGEGETPLHVAFCSEKSDKLVKYLLEKIPPVSRVEMLQRKDENGSSAFQSAMKNAALVNVTLNHLTSEDLQQLITEQTEIDCSRLTHKNVICVFNLVSEESRYKLASKQNKKGNTILHHANLKVAEVVLSKLSPAHQQQVLNLRNHDGESALQMAESKGKHSLAEELKKYSQLAGNATDAERSLLDSVTAFPSWLTNAAGPADTSAHQIQIGSHSTVSVKPLVDITQPPSSFSETRTEPGNNELHNAGYVPVSPAYNVDSLTSSQLSLSSTQPYTGGTASHWLPNMWSPSAFTPTYAATQSAVVHSAAVPLPPTSLSSAPSTNTSYLSQDAPHQEMASEQFQLDLFGSAEHNRNTWVASLTKSAPQPSTSKTQILPNLEEFNDSDAESVTSGVKRSAGNQAACSPEPGTPAAKSARYGGYVEGQVLNISCPDDAFSVSFKPTNTVSQVVSEVENETGKRCSIHGQKGFRCTASMTLDLVNPPFVIKVGDEQATITSSLNTGDKNVNETTTSGGTTRFGRVSNVQEVVDLLSFVHERIKEGKTVSKGLQLAKKDRKTIDRFLNIYYLYCQNREKMLQLETEWNRKRKPGGLQRLDSLAKNEINWEQLQELFDDGSVADFTVRGSR